MQVPLLMGQPIAVSRAWWRFAREACQEPVYRLLRNPEIIDFGDGPDEIFASYLSETGTLLEAHGVAEYEDSGGVVMRSAYVVRWYNPAYTLDPETIWTERTSWVTALGPVPVPQTQPVETPPAEVRPAEVHPTEEQ